MPNADRNEGSDHLEATFREAILAEFGFLSALGFTSFDAGAHCMQFRSDAILVSIFRGPLDYVVEVYVGQLTSRTRYDLDSIIAWAGPNAWKSEGFGRGEQFQASSPMALRNIVRRASGLLQKYGLPFLTGDAAFYQSVEKWWIEKSARDALLARLDKMRQQLEIAWKARDYDKVVALLEPFQSNLTPAESMKLSYAYARVGRPRPRTWLDRLLR